ncbi:amino acid adenylation domain-containing protein [Flavivirga jejuensis]
MLPKVDIAQIKSRLTHQKAGAEYYEELKSWGLNLGRSFQGMETLYFSEEEALNKIRLDIKPDYVLQPGLMDSALHTCLGINFIEDSSVLKLPDSVGEVTIYGDVSKTSLCYARKSQEGRGYDIDLLSDEGDVLLRFKNYITSVENGNKPNHEVQITTNKQKEPKEKIFSQSVTSTLKISKIKEEKKVIEVEAETTLKDICYKGILQVLMGMGIENGSDADMEKLRIDLGIIDKYQRLFNELIRSLSISNYLSIEENKLVVFKDTLKLFKLEETFNSAKEAYPDYTAYFNLLEACLKSFEGILKGTIRSTDIIFPEGSMDLVAGIYKKNEHVDYFNRLLCQLVKTAVKNSIANLEEGEKFTLLEVGAGTGGTSELLFEVLKEFKDHIRYIYTDISKSFLIYAEDKYRDVATYLETTLFNIEKTPVNQGIDFGTCDMVIGANVVHATKDIKTSISNIKSVLKKEGILLLNELAETEMFFTLTFGLLEGWWLYQDSELRLEGSPGLPEENWKKVFTNTGFDNVVFYPQNEKSTQQIIVAKSDGEIEISSELEQETESKHTKKIEDSNFSSNTKLVQNAENYLKEIISRVLKLDKDRINTKADFGSMGIDSILIGSITKEISEDFPELSASVFFEYLTINELASYFVEEYESFFKKEDNNGDLSTINDGLKMKESQSLKFSKRKRFSSKAINSSETNKKNVVTVAPKEQEVKQQYETVDSEKLDVAIIGMGGRFSSASTEEELWDKTISNSQLKVDGLNAEVSYGKLADLEYESVCATLNLSEFDLSMMSFQERLIFEELTKSMLKYGVKKEDLSSKPTGVFLAAQQQIYKGGTGDSFSLVHLIPNKISYHLNLKGPSEFVNTACTSSYVAIHRAIQSMASGECEQAIIGGINVISPEEMSIEISEFNEVFSKKGYTLSFGDNADGYVRSEGVGVLIIKLLEHAKKENNQVLGVIKGSSVFHGGKGFSFDAPNPKGLKNVIEKSLMKSSIPVDTIDYVEAHGIANRIADAMELEAIDSVYKKYSKNPKKKWHIGTVKPVIGHTELVSGIASIIKVLKAFEHKMIPGIAGLEQINTELNPNHSLVFNKQSQYWENGNHPRRAALNSYAVGGMNAHIVLEEYSKPGVDKEPRNSTFEERKGENRTNQEANNRESLQNKIKSIAEDTFEIKMEALDLSLSPIDYDFDSVKVIQFVRRINEYFEVEVKMGQILSADDFESAFNIIEMAITNLNGNVDEKEKEKKTLPEKYPLSEGQKGLWHIQLFDPNSIVYNVPVGLCLKGDIDADLIYKVAEHILEAYPALRVVFAMDAEGELFQELRPANGLLLQDVQELKDDENSNDVFKRLLHTPFDLSKEVIRLHVRINKREQKTYALFVIHHAVFDGTSFTPFISMFTKSLKQLRMGNSLSKNRASDRTYFDFVAWEIDYIQSKQGLEDLSYWQEKLSGDIEKLSLPYDHVDEEALEVYETNGIEKIELDGELLKVLKSNAKSLKVNLSLYLLVAFKILLNRLTNQEDILVTMPTSGRPKEEFEKGIGYYVNMMLTRTEVSGEKGFLDVLKALKSEFMVAIDHLKYPYPKMLTEIGLVKGSGDTLFSTSFIYQNIFDETLNLNPEAEVRFMDSVQQEIINEYSMEILDLEEQFTIQIKYKKKLFSDSSIKRHLEYYKRILEATITNPNIKVTNVKMLSEKEESQQLYVWNDTKVTYPKGKSIHELFETQAKQTPNKIALMFEGTALTYEALEFRSRKLAIYLQNRGVKTETLVGIFMERSIEVIVTILGVLRSGGAYVPIDCDYPNERINYIVNDSIVNGNDENATKLILTQDYLKKDLVNTIENQNIEVFSIASDWNDNEIILNTTENLKSVGTPNNVAYIMYTSGSTGQPKGVVVEHKNVVRLVKNSNFYAFCSEDVLLTTGALSFDATTVEFFGPLLNGGKLVVSSREVLLNNQLLSQIIIKNNVNIMWFTSGWLNQIVEADCDLFKNLKTVLVGGEKLSPKHIRELKNNCHDLEIINGYGPTENTTFSLTYKIEEVDDSDIPIGKPINNTTAYILNDSNKLQPVGVSGELCLGGDGVARGYLNRQDLTDEKFISNFFDKGRLYKTGDLARWLPDGNIEFIGRIDNQVKIRGFRIELGEIENAINNHEHVQSSVVIIKDYNGSKNLIAFCILERTELNVPGLKDYLSKTLPDYMIPASIVPIEEIPLTVNGKIDRKALLNRNIEVSREAKFISPTTETEERLAEIWQEILSIDQVSLNDNFFELGGHSLLVTKLLSRIHKKFNVDLELSKLFDFPDLQGLAKEVDSSQLKLLPPITIVEKREQLPLSSAQQRLWFLAEIGQGNRYHVPAKFRIKGALNIHALEQSLVYLINRHESLRTTFRKNDSENAFQHIDSNAMIDVVIVDCTKFSLQEKENETQKLFKSLVYKPFDLSKGPLLRFLIITLDKDEFLFGLCMHHIISDAWSINIMFRELNEIYAAYIKGNSPTLKPLPVQYIDYTMWQHDLFKNDLFSKGLAHWVSHLKNYTNLSLPQDFARPQISSGKGKRLTIEFEASTLNQLKQFSVHSGGTLFTSLMTGVYILLHKYSHQDDICVGVTAANRPHSNLEDLIGFFINTLVNRIQFDQDDTLLDIFKKTHQELIRSQEYQNIPFDRIVDAIQPERDTARTPIFQVMVNYASIDEPLELKESTVVFEPLEYNASKFDLTFDFSNNPKNDSLILSLEYNTDIFSEDTVKRFLIDIQSILTSLPKQQDSLLKEYSFLTKKEQYKLLENFNVTNIAFPKDQCIHNIFETQAKQIPNNIALSFEDEEITYKELEYRSKKLALYLQKQGVKPDTLIGICIGRSIEMVVAILGVLRSGGTYVPIDPEYPQDRINYMLNDSVLSGNDENAVKFVITNSNLKQNILEGFEEQGVKVISLFENWKENKFLLSVRGKLKHMSSPNNAAYVIYTSGSTGKPKGVIVEHRNVVSLLKNKESHFDFNEQDVWTMFHSFCFDFSVWEMYGALLYGGKLIVVPEKTTKNPSAFAQLLFEKKVTVLNQTPGAFYLLQELYLSTYSATDIRYIIFGGEALSPLKLQEWYKIHPQSKLINMYGITETTVHVTFKRIQEAEINSGISNIGKAIPTLSCYILDAAQNVCPIGIPGELYVSGVGVARGYLNRPELTQDRFIQNPFKEASRLYRTGDLARWLSNGNMEYLGRIDNQVKIRGFRIELGEIEMQLQFMEAIRDAVVLAKSVENGKKELIAYIVFKDAERSTAEIRDFLSKSLPDYMIPSHYVQLEHIPLTRNGKVDRKALPDIDGSGISSGVDYVAPRNSIEKEIAQIWQAHFSLDRVGIKDDYFQLGGDSIKTIRLISILNKSFNIGFPIVSFYENPTIEGMAYFISQSSDQVKDIRQLKENIDKTIADIETSVKDNHPQPHNIANVYPMSDIQTGMIYTSELMRENNELGVYHDQFVFQFKALDIQLLTRAMELMVEKHETLRTSYHLYDFKKQVQIIHKKAPVNIEVEDISKLTQEEIQIHIQKFLEHERIQNPFDVTKAPNWRIHIFQIADSDIILTFQFHHAMFDGWSEKNFRVELFETYKALKKNKAYRPVTLKSSMYDSIVSDFIESRNEANISFWKNKISDYKRLDIFTDNQTSNRLFKKYDKRFTSKVLSKCKQDNIEPKTLFIAGYVYILNLLSSQEDITAGLVSHRRPIIEDGDKLLGCFLNSIPFRFNMLLSKGCTWIEYIRLIASELQELKGKDRLSLNEISVMANENYSSNPFFDVLFNYVDFHVLDKFQDNEEVHSSQSENQEEDISLLGFERTNTHLDITVSLTGKEIMILINQERDLKSGHQLKDLVAYFETFFNNYLLHDGKHVNSLDIISKSETQKLLYDFNKTEILFPEANKCIHKLFEVQAKQTPDNIALSYENTEITYKELDERSKKLALYLQKHGVKPNTLVGICMDRSIEMIIGILGILKSGGAYVPIDPEYPEQRKKFIVSDSVTDKEYGAGIIISQEHLGESIRDITKEFGVREIVLSPNWEKNQSILKVKGTLKNETTFNALAYVIYTSGSTGKPKGVLVKHENVTNLLRSQKLYFQVEESDQFLLFSNFSFDASVEQMYLALLNGGTLHLISSKDILDMERFSNILKNKKITHLHTTPSFMRELPYIPDSCLKRLISGGDVFDEKIFARWGDKGVKIINEYGPTETTVTSIQREIASDEKNIGKPIGNTFCYIIDASHNIQSVGVPGELCIGGKGVTAGYLNRQELTQEKFIKNPFRDGMLYKTGDLARWLPDGNLEFLGRIDDQVKIRGYRIELGEIEYTLNQHGSIQNSVVIAKEHLGTKQLVAYSVPAIEGEKIDPHLIKEFLSRSLPEYMIPSFIISLDMIPLTTNGKIDRKALNRKELEIASVHAYVAPTTKMELKLVEIWQKVLHVDRIGIQDNFFELGGHSLLAIQLIQHIRNDLNKPSFMLKDFISTPTIKNHALLLDNSKDKRLDPHLIVFNQLEDTSSNASGTFIIPGMPGIVDGYEALAEKFAENNNSVYGIQMQGTLNGDAFLKTLEEQAAHNTNIIKKLNVRKVTLVAHSYGGLVVNEMVVQLEKEAIEVEKIVLLDSYIELPKVTVEEEVKSLFLMLSGNLNLSLDTDEVTAFSEKISNKSGKAKQQLMYDFLLEKGVNVNKAFFFNIINIYDNAMKMTYELSSNLTHSIDVIKAKKSYSDDPTLGWAPYYKSVNVIETESDHFGLIKEPFVSRWINELVLNNKK